MNILNKLTIENLKLNKKRTIVTIIGIILSTALICAVAGMITSFQKTLVDAEISLDGKYHVGVQDVNKEELQYMENNKNIEDYFEIGNLGYSLIDNTNIEQKYVDDNKPYFNVLAADDKTFENASIKIAEGTTPTNNEEIIVEKDLLKRLNKSIGDTITFDLNDRYDKETLLKRNDPYVDGETLTKTTTKTYKIVGTMEEPINILNDYYSPSYIAITKDELPEVADIYIFLKNSKTYSDTLETINVDGKNTYVLHTELLRWEGSLLSDNNMKMITALGGIVIGIIIVTSVFVIRNSFAISITEKLKLYGMLSSTGATSKQIRKNVLFEGLILGLISIPIGIICGVVAILLLIIIINLILVDFLNGIKFVYSVPLLPILLAIILSSVTIFLSTLSSARKAAKISPIEAIRGNNDIKIKSKKLTTPKFIKKMFGIGGDIAYKNVKRNKKKFRTTVISLIVSISIFLAASALIDYGFKMSEVYYKDLSYTINISDSLENINNIVKKFNIDDYNIIKEVGMSSNINNYLNDAGKEFNNGCIEPLTTSVIAISDQQFQKYVKSLNLDYEKVKYDGIIIDNVYLTINEQKYTGKILDMKNDTNITISNDEGYKKDINIAMVTEKRPMGLEFYYYTGSVIIIDDSFTDIQFTHDATIYINEENAADLEEKITESFPDTSTYNIQESVKAMNAMVLIVSIFLYGFIAIITLIGVTNIFNTITTSMNLRSKEFAMLKSIGMTSKEFNKMIRLESIMIGLKSLLFGLPIGCVLSYLIFLSMEYQMIMQYVLPYKYIIISVVFVFLVILLIMKYSLSKINKQNIIETIRNDNI